VGRDPCLSPLLIGNSEPRVERVADRLGEEVERAERREEEDASAST
jgi:hypothetical protein